MSGHELEWVAMALAHEKSQARDLRIALVECQDYLASLVGMFAELHDWAREYGGELSPAARSRFLQIVSNEFGPVSLAPNGEAGNALLSIEPALTSQPQEVIIRHFAEGVCAD